MSKEVSQTPAAPQETLLTEKEKEAALSAQAVKAASETPAESDPADQSASSEEEGEITEESETSDEVEAKEDEGEAEPKDAKPKKKSKIQERFNKLTKARTAAEERAVRAEVRAQLLEEQLKAGSSKKESELAEKPGNSKSDAEPDINDFEHYQDYLKAVAKWTAKEELKAEREAQKANSIKTEYEKQMEAHDKRVQAFAEKHDDYQDVIATVSEFDVPIAIATELQNSENGPELLYELLKERNTLEKICTMSGNQALKALGVFEDGLLKSKTKKSSIENTVSKAPAPISPVGNKATGAAKKSIYDAKNMSQSEWEALRNAESGGA